MKSNFLLAAVLAAAAVVLLTGNTIAQTGTFTEIAPKPVPIVKGKVELSPKTTMIEFVGTHVGDDPKPRVGGFKTFTGQIGLANGNSGIKFLNLEIDVNSIWTEFSKLSGHLKNADFFETDKFGKSSFKSTKIGKDDRGNLMVTGNLMLLGQKKEITFPIMVRVSDDSFMLKSEFKIDRTLFGMDKMTSGVEKEVSLQMVVGQPTTPRKEVEGPGTDKTKKKEDSSTQSVSISAPNMT